MRAALLTLLIAALARPPRRTRPTPRWTGPVRRWRCGPPTWTRPPSARRGSPAPAARPVLLSPGTGATADENFSWNYERSLTARGIPWCGITMPGHAQGDIQVSAEYLVHAIRRIHRLSGRRVAVMGHSQGGMSMRWALRFWPDTRPMVDDVIGFAGSNHGTDSGGGCANGCTPAGWQQGAESNFIAALNSRAETHAGVSYTEVYTHRDEVVTPERRRQRQLVGARRRGPDHERGHPGHLPREHQRALHRRDHRPGGLRAGHGRARPRRPRVGGAGRPRGVHPGVRARGGPDLPRHLPADRVRGAGGGGGRGAREHDRRAGGAPGARAALLRVRRVHAGQRRLGRRRPLRHRHRHRPRHGVRPGRAGPDAVRAAAAAAGPPGQEPQGHRPLLRRRRRRAGDRLPHGPHLAQGPPGGPRARRSWC